VSAGRTPGEVAFVITPENAEAIRQSLSWRADMLVTNDFGERVWLKPLLVNERYEEDPNGRRIGITDCCFEDVPCEHHAALVAGEVKP
jgi:hypothetical protein